MRGGASIWFNAEFGAQFDPGSDARERRLDKRRDRGVRKIARPQFAKLPPAAGKSSPNRPGGAERARRCRLALVALPAAASRQAVEVDSEPMGTPLRIVTTVVSFGALVAGFGFAVAAFVVVDQHAAQILTAEPRIGQQVEKKSPSSANAS